MKNHTPTPWYISTDLPWAIRKDIKDKSFTIAVCDGWAEEDKPNAAFIVKAVNAHDELVAGMKKMIFLADTLDHLQSNEEARKYADMGRAILAKVQSCQ